MLENVEIDLRNYIAQNFLFNKNGFPFGDEVSLLEEGLIDSMNVLELVMFVEEKFGVSVEDSEIVPDNFDSVQKLAAYIRRKVPNQRVSNQMPVKKTKGFNAAVGGSQS